MQDSQMINNLLGDSHPHEFKKASWRYLGDSNSGTYSNGNINFNTQSIRKAWKDMHNAYLAIPISVTGTSAYTGAELVAFKASVLSFIYGIGLKVNGVSVANDVNIQFINNLKLLIERSIDWSDINGPELHYAKDNNVATDANDGSKFLSSTIYTGASNVATSTTITSSSVQTQNPTYNAGFYKRSAYLRGNTNYENSESIASVITNSRNFVTSGGANATFGVPASIGTTPVVSSYSLTLTIPLKLVHSCFDALNIPLIGDDMEITVLTTNNGSNSFPPMTVPTGTYAPVVTIRSQCRLYYRELEFSPDVSKILEEKFESGFSKMFYYTCTDFFQPSACLANTATTMTQTVTTSSINPTRLWAVFYPAGKLVAQINSNSPFIANVQALTSNVRVNNKRLFEADLATSNEHWEQFKEQLAFYDGFTDSNKSQVNYNDYLANYSGYHCYDLQRAKENLVSANSPNEIVFTCTKPSTSVDIAFLVERQVVIKLDMTKSGVRVLIG